MRPSAHELVVVCALLLAGVAAPAQQWTPSAENGLDFLVVSDHAEHLRPADLIPTADPELLATAYGKGE